MLEVSGPRLLVRGSSGLLTLSFLPSALSDPCTPHPSDIKLKFQVFKFYRTTVLLRYDMDNDGFQWLPTIG